MIKNIVFDMGGVLIRFEPRKYIRRLNVSPEEEELLYRQVFRSLEWARMDRGSMTDAEAAEIICRRVPEHLHEGVRRLVLQWDRTIDEYEGMYELIEELKNAGYGIYLLSNASLRHPYYWPKTRVSRLFDGLLVSAEVHFVKPQPEIYRLLCERFSLKPEECFFIDDLPTNIEGAYNFGIAGTVFHEDTGELREVLRAAGVRVRALPGPDV